MIYGNRIYGQDIYEKDRGSVESIAYVAKERIARTDEESALLLRELVTDNSPMSVATREQIKEIAQESAIAREAVYALEALDLPTREMIARIDTLIGGVREPVYESASLRNIVREAVHETLVVIGLARERVYTSAEIVGVLREVISDIISIIGTTREMVGKTIETSGVARERISGLGEMTLSVMRENVASAEHTINPLRVIVSELVTAVNSPADETVISSLIDGFLSYAERINYLFVHTPHGNYHETKSGNAYLTANGETYYRTMNRPYTE